MDRFLERFWNFVARDPALTLQVRTFRLICVTMGILCLGVVLPSNAFQSTPIQVNVANAFLGVLGIWCYRDSCRGRHHTLLVLGMVVGLMDLAWYWNAGSQGSVTFYFFPVILYPLAVFQGRKRWILSAAVILNTCALLLLEHARPDLVTPFRGPSDRLIDLVAGLASSALALIMVVGAILASYEWQLHQNAQVSRDLATSEQNYRELVENAQSIILRLDRQGRITFLNRHAEELFGWNREELLGTPLLGSLIPPTAQDGTDHAALVNNLLSRKGQTDLESSCRDGRRLRIAWTTQPAPRRPDGEPEILCVGADLTRRHETELRRRQADHQAQHIQRLEGLGILAGGIAHDFNNLLTAILGNISLARIHSPPHSEQEETLRGAEQACAQARKLTVQLLTFAKGGQPVRTTLPLAPLLHASGAQVTRGFPITCHFDLPDDLWTVEADAGQIGQALHNLLLNARQSMPHGGTITLAARNLPLPPPNTRLPPNPVVEVSIRDQGAGIAPEHLTRVFEPYFTTRPGNSGLGLAVVHSIIRKHHGHIQVESTLQSGTVVTLWLPARHAPSTPVPADPPKPKPAPGRILVMDDEVLVRKVIGKALVRLGLEAELTRDGAEALAAYQRARSEGRPFSLVILDLTVPGGMGGEEAMRELLRLDPDVRAIATSGYSHSPVMAEFANYGFKAAIAKPFVMEEFAAKIRETLPTESHSGATHGSSARVDPVIE